MRSALPLLLLLAVLCACKNENAKPPFTLEAPAETVTDGDLEALLATAPFENPFNEENHGRISITNIPQVFPFAGKYYGTYGRLIDYGPYAEVYERHLRAFEDPRFGNAFVQASLLYGDGPVALPKRMSEGANVIIEGVDQLDRRHSATAHPTGLRDSTAAYRADVFWVDANRERFLTGLYQRGQLVVDFGFPCPDTVACLRQLAAINAELGLGVSTWGRASAADLRVDPSADPFWSDPEVELLRNPGTFFGRVRLPLKLLGFTEINPSQSQTELFQKADQVFQAKRAGRVYEFAASARPMEDTYETFDAAMQSAGYEPLRPVVLRPIYKTGTAVKDGTTTVTWKAYLDEGELVEFRGAYPSDAAEFEDRLGEVMRRGRIVNL